MNGPLACGNNTDLDARARGGDGTELVAGLGLKVRQLTCDNDQVRGVFARAGCNTPVKFLTNAHQGALDSSGIGGIDRIHQHMR